MLIVGIDTPGYASLMIVVLLMGAIQLVSLGIIGEYLGRLFLEVKGRPIYVVEGVYEDGDRPAAPILTHDPDRMDLKEEDILGADIGRHWYYRAKAAALRRAVGDLAPAAHPRCRRGLGLLLAPSAGRDRRAIRALRRYRLPERPRRQRRPASPCSTAATPARPTATSC